MGDAISLLSDNPTDAAGDAEKEAGMPGSYEAAMTELERLVASMEAGQLPLDRLLVSYKRGAELLNFCKLRLEAVESQVQVLEGGQLKPWKES